MVLLSGEGKDHTAQTNDAFNNANAQSVIFQMRALFDMRLEEAQIVMIRRRQARHAGQPCLGQGIREGDAVLVR